MLLLGNRLTDFSDSDAADRGKRRTYCFGAPLELRDGVVGVPECLEHQASPSSLLTGCIDSCIGFGLVTSATPRAELRTGKVFCLGISDAPVSSTKIPTKAESIATATKDKNCMQRPP